MIPGPLQHSCYCSECPDDNYYMSMPEKICIECDEYYHASEDGKIQAKQMVDTSASDYNVDGAGMEDEQIGDYNIGADATDIYQQNGTHAFCINPLNTDMILSGQLSLQILELQAQKKSVKLLHDFQGQTTSQKFINCVDWSTNGQFVACGDIDGQS